jgi:hypothetical protein
MMNEYEELHAEERALNFEEKTDCLDLLQALDDVLNHFGNADHTPHGLSTFCHRFYHDLFEPEMYKHIKALHDKALRGDEVEGVETISADESFVEPSHLEGAVRHALEIMLLVGSEYASRGYRYARCSCIEHIGDKVENLLRDGTWKQ